MEMYPKIALNNLTTISVALILILFVMPVSNGMAEINSPSGKFTTVDKLVTNLLDWMIPLENRPSRLIVRVGSMHRIKTPAQAALEVRDWNIIEIESDTYVSSGTIWKANNLIIRSVNGRSHIKSSNNISNGKALWVIQGNNVKIENIQFSGAQVSSNNGAGIRGEGRNLAVINCLFNNNQNGILAGRKQGSTVLIERTEFHHNGYPDGRAHNLYIGAVDALIFRYNYSHHARVGHNLKSRAKRNFIIYNMLQDEKDGNSSYITDLPNGGESYLIGNVFQQGVRAENNGVISFGLEGNLHENSWLFAINNTFISDRKNTVFVKNIKDRKQVFINNLFVGQGRLYLNSLSEQKNYGPISTKDYMDDFLLNTNPKGHKKFANLALTPIVIDGVDFQPQYEPNKDRIITKRKTQGKLGVGAFEYSN